MTMHLVLFSSYHQFDSYLMSISKIVLQQLFTPIPVLPASPLVPLSPYTASNTTDVLSATELSVKSITSFCHKYLLVEDIVGIDVLVIDEAEGAVCVVLVA